MLLAPKRVSSPAEDHFFLAAFAGQTDTALSILERMPELLNQEYGGGGSEKTALRIAYDNGHFALALALIDKGANDSPLAADDGMYLFHKAAKEGYLIILSTLFAKTPTLLNKKDVNGLTALHWAARCGFCEIVDYLILQGAEISALDNQEKTPLDWANNGTSDVVIKRLSDAGARTNEVPILAVSVTRIISTLFYNPFSPIQQEPTQARNNVSSSETPVMVEKEDGLTDEADTPKVRKLPIENGDFDWVNQFDIPLGP